MFCNNELNEEELLNWINLFLIIFIKIYNFETMRTEFFDKQNFFDIDVSCQIYHEIDEKHEYSTVFYFLFF